LSLRRVLAALFRLGWRCQCDDGSRVCANQRAVEVFQPGPKIGRASDATKIDAELIEPLPEDLEDGLSDRFTKPFPLGPTPGYMRV